MLLKLIPKSVLLVVSFLLTSGFTNARLNTEHQVYDSLVFNGSEQILNFGMDTTNNIWYLTQPYTNRYRLYINNYTSDQYQNIGNVTFANNGKDWAFMGIRQTTIELVSPDTIIQTPGLQFGEIEFSPLSTFYTYSYRIDNIEYLNISHRVIQLQNRVSKFHIGFDTTQVAFITQRAGISIVNILDKEIGNFDEVKPFGFRSNGEFCYAARLGNWWKVYQGTKTISDQYTNIIEPQVNQDGSTIAYIGKNYNNWEQVVVNSDKYDEDKISRQYPAISSLILNPINDLTVFVGVNQNIQDLNYSNTVIASGVHISHPFFTPDYYDVFTLVCDNDCNPNISGKRYFGYNFFTPNSVFALKPRSEVIGYLSPYTMQIKSLTQRNASLGKIMDYINHIRYNRRTERFEALGIFNNMLYLLYGN